jgi:hypothetical protein
VADGRDDQRRAAVAHEAQDLHEASAVTGGYRLQPRRRELAVITSEPKTISRKTVEKMIPMRWVSDKVRTLLKAGLR